MGNTVATQTKPLDQRIAENQNFNIGATISKEVSENIGKLGNIIQAFNSNDSDEMLKLVDDYQNMMKQKGMQTIDLTNIRTNIKQFHDLVLKNFENVPYEQRNAKRKEMLKRANIPGLLTEELRKRVEEDKNAILQNNLIQKDANIKKGIDSIFENISTIRAKYKYFEHEYIHMNLFLIVFLQHTHSTMDKFINDVIRISIERDKYRHDLMDSLIKLLIEILTKSEIDIKPSDFNMINGMMENLEAATKKSQQTMEKEFAVATKNAMNNVLNVPLPSVNTKQQDRANGQRTSQGMMGGFIRDHSIFPQSFYEL